MAKLTLNLDDAWAKALSRAAHLTNVSVNEYLRQLIAHDMIVAEAAVGSDGVLPPISKAWGRRKVTEDIEHTEVKRHSPFGKPYIADTNELTPNEIVQQRKLAAQQKFEKKS